MTQELQILQMKQELLQTRQELLEEEKITVSLLEALMENLKNELSDLKKKYE